MSDKREYFSGNFRGRKFEEDEKEKSEFKGQVNLERGRRMDKGQKSYQDIQDDKALDWFRGM